MQNDKNLISLKEAAKISGYSADYIGQLIRSGKIPGKQVYVNVAWMTTAEAVLAYKQGETSDKQDDGGMGNIFSRFKRRIGMELQILRLFFDNFRTAKSIVAVLVVSFILLNLSIIYFLANKQTNGGPGQTQSEDKLSY